MRTRRAAPAITSGSRPNNLANSMEPGTPRLRQSLFGSKGTVSLLPVLEKVPLRDFVVHRTLGQCAGSVDETDKKNQPGTAIHFSCMQECRLSLPEAVS